MIVKSDFQTGSAGNLITYISEDAERTVEIRDSTGRKLSEKEIEAFVGRSETADMQRQFIIAPDPDAGYTAAEIDQCTRSTLNEWKAEKPSVEYVYGVHARPESGKSHAHAAAIGKQRDLHMETDDLTSLREQARERFRERTRLRSRERVQERSVTAEQEREVTQAQEDYDDI